MSMDREQETLASNPESKPGDVWHAFEQAYGGWLKARGLIHASHSAATDAEMEALANEEAECARALWSMPAERGYQVFMKLEALEHYLDSSNWADQRDLRLLASIKTDLRQLLP